MNYEIHIQDVDQLLEPMVLEYSEQGSVERNKLGGDDKTQPIVGTELNFSMEVGDGQDGKYIQFFTSDEQKYLVTEIVSAEQVSEEDRALAGTILFKGYLLPESYSEPWENPLFYPRFSAVDGLGLLKGKKLTDDFYEEEKTVIEIIAACLELTGLDLEIYLSPAITSHYTEFWHEVLFDTRNFRDRERPDRTDSAYDILEKMISSKRCQIFQEDARWYIEGINKRHLLAPEYYRYAVDGSYLGTLTIERTVLTLDWMPGTEITMVPALKEVIVTHEKAPLEFSEEVVSEDPDWRLTPGVPSDIFPWHWSYAADYLPVMKAPDYYLELPLTQVPMVDTRKKVQLRDKPYILAGSRIRVDFEFELVPDKWLNSEEIEQHIDNEDWRHLFWYSVTVAGEMVGINILPEQFPGMNLAFNNSLKAVTHLDFVATKNGFLDVVIYAPFGYVSQKEVTAVRVTKLTIENKDEQEVTTYTETIAEGSSQVKEIELAVSEDVLGRSASFYLERKREYAAEYFITEVPIQYGFTLGGNHYSVVSIEGARLIEQYIDSVQYYIPIPGKPPFLTDLEVIYNLNGGEQMVVKSEQLFATGSFKVLVRNFKEPLIDRVEWIQWSDAIYGVEKKGYAQVVAEIERKLFAVPHLRITGTAMNHVRFNNLVEFSFRGEKKYFPPTDLRWSGDRGESVLTLVEGVYSGESQGNIPPFVYAGPDIYLSDGETVAQITEAVATDPGGYIETLTWRQISGPGSAVITTPATLNPALSALTGDSYEFELEVVDNLGLAATDTMRVIRVSGYEISFEQTMNYDAWALGSGSSYHYAQWKINVAPAIPAGEQLVLQFEASIVVEGFRKATYMNVRKNTQQVFEIGTHGGSAIDETYEGTGSVAIAPGDDLRLYIQSSWDSLAPASTVDYLFRITEAGFQGENGTVSNLPATQTFTHVKPS